MMLGTLCYVRSSGRTLMLHRIKKERDMHQGKWNGLGGKVIPGESPEECVIREVQEESGLDIASPRLRGILTFPAFDGIEDWYVFVFIAEQFEGQLIDSPEGVLRWVPDSELLALELWEGDRVFLPWLDREDFFSGKFVYADGKLASHTVHFHPTP